MNFVRIVAIRLAMSDSSLSGSEREINRKDPLEWSHPKAPLEKYSGLDPRLWLCVIFIEIPLLIKWYLWHKRQSRQASRTNIAIEARVAAQKLDFIDREDVPRHQRENARRAKQSLRYICDELNMEHEGLDRYLDTDS